MENLSVTVIRDQDIIESLPAGNGNLNDLLETVPGVQFSEKYHNSFQAGEIKPPEISISGGRPGDNKYILDGVGFNSYFDPNVTNKSYIHDIPGHSQEFFLPAHLIESVTIYRSNIPARYGGFTGGVEIVETKDPETKIGGELSYKTTRDEWTHFYIDPHYEEDFYTSTDESYQPNFSIDKSYGLFNLPINDNSGLFLFVSRLESAIPLTLFTEKETQYRRNDVIFLKYVFEPALETKITLGGLYNKYQEDLFLKHTSDSQFKLDNGGYKIAGKLEHESDIGKTEANLSWQKSGNNRDAPTSHFNWTTTDIKDAGAAINRTRSPEGGYGDIEKSQESITVNLHQEFPPVHVAGVEHFAMAGAEVKHVKATYDRIDTSTNYSAALVNASVDCTGNEEDCIDGDQFFWYKTVYPEDQADASVSNYSAYIEDKMEISRLTLKPGLRISYSDYQKNTDYAPRFATTYDLFGNDKTQFFGGYNRYYNDDLLADNLREQKKPYEIWWRFPAVLVDGQPPEWQLKPRSSINLARARDLHTPYSDEFTAGIRQKLFGGRLELLYIHRDYKDQIVTINIDDPDGTYTYQEFRNEGRRYHEEASISWEKWTQKHYLFFDVTWQETKTNSEHFDDLFELDELDEFVWYDGRAVRRDKLLASNYSRPYTGKLIYRTKLPYGLSFTNKTVYRSRYRSVDTTGDTFIDPNTGAELEVFEKVSNQSSLIFDWLFTWETPSYKSNRLVFELEILNVFNRRVALGEKVDEYRLGRQYWAGLTYKF